MIKKFFNAGGANMVNSNTYKKKKGLNRLIDKYIFMEDKQDIPIYFLVLLSSLVGLITGFFLLFLVTDSPIKFIFDNFAGEKNFYVYFFILLSISAIIGLGLAFSKK